MSPSINKVVTETFLHVCLGFSHVTLWNTRYVYRLELSEVLLTGVCWGTGTAWAWGAKLDCTCKLWEVRTGDRAGDERGVDSAWSRYEYVEDFSQWLLFVRLKFMVTDLDKTLHVLKYVSRMCSWCSYADEEGWCELPEFAWPSVFRSLSSDTICTQLMCDRRLSWHVLSLERRTFIVVCCLLFRFCDLNIYGLSVFYLVFR